MYKHYGFLNLVYDWSNHWSHHWGGHWGGHWSHWSHWSLHNHRWPLEFGPATTNHWHLLEPREPLEPKNH